MTTETRKFSLSPTQWGFAAVALIIVAFLIIGSVNQNAAPTENAFGLQGQSFVALAFVSFLGGLLSFASPCTLPILPAYFAFAFQSGRRQIAANTLFFLLGLASMFSLLGAGASFIGRFLLNNQRVILIVGGAVVLVFGVMSLIGKGFTGVQAQEEQQRDTTYFGSYMFGLTFAVGWSSCVGPILGTVLTMAATTGSVLRGVLLLFIYALGLGLPLLIVSTFFGRQSRDSLFWRFLRGKGKQVTTSVMVLALIWGLAAWRIMVAVIDFAFFNDFRKPPMSIGIEYGLLILSLILAAAYFFLTSKETDYKVSIDLHSTQLISGVLFILMGVLFLNDQLATINQYIPPDLALWFADFEDVVVGFFS